MSKVICKKDMFGSNNKVQYFWKDGVYDVCMIYKDGGISVYTEINTPRTSVFFNGYHFFEYFMTLEDFRDEKLNQLL